ncbi:hypothetical protein HPB51_017802 [Rhipicephalus microplus]|uniref:Elongation of very long chain fatty acids protein n=1 Tax=Rhipicephalus microplus TaxID=6941 RepID=A0A9J6DX00_RHIMP|nr:hypothetical protein HPB51_017802 [Rhipicephalus microplus]
MGSSRTQGFVCPVSGGPRTGGGVFSPAVTRLHVIHHCIVVWNGWVGLTFGAEGQIMICICINCLVHVIMYSYYFLSSFGPAMRRYLWWKRYLTMMQIAQLSFFVIYAMVPMVHECNYPRILLWIGFAAGGCAAQPVLQLLPAYVQGRRPEAAFASQGESRVSTPKP